MQTKRALALAGLTVALVGCTALAPPASTARQPAAGGGAVAAQPAPAAPAAALARAEAQQIPIPPPQPPINPGVPTAGMTVIGEGQVRADPDVAYVSAGVQTQGPTAREAQDANTAKMQAVLARIKALGIPDADVKTSGVSLHPVFDRNPAQPTGYTASNSVTVTVRQVARAGEILDAAITSGANQSAGVQFGLLNDTQQRRTALDEAVKGARSRADAIAASAGVRITGIVSLIDESASGTARPAAAMNRAVAAEMAQADVPIQPGQLTVTARVRIVYQFQ